MARLRKHCLWQRDGPVSRLLGIIPIETLRHALIVPNNFSGGVFGGFINDTIGWRYAFYIQVPFIIGKSPAQVFRKAYNVTPDLGLDSLHANSYSRRHNGIPVNRRTNQGNGHV